MELKSQKKLKIENLRMQKQYGTIVESEEVESYMYLGV